MKIDEALVEIEATLRQIDAITLYEPMLSRSMQNILRKVRNEKKEEVVVDMKRL